MKPCGDRGYREFFGLTNITFYDNNCFSVVNSLQFNTYFSTPRVNRYFLACNHQHDLTLELYKLNIKIGQSLFEVINHFEVVLRNSIDQVMRAYYGREWLYDSIQQGGMFDSQRCRKTKRLIEQRLNRLINLQQRPYSPDLLLAEMDFGIWTFLYAQPQYNASNRILLQVFPLKPISNRFFNINNTLVFNLLKDINGFRNRIAHHEPLIFDTGSSTISLNSVHRVLFILLGMLKWMKIEIDYDFMGVTYTIDALRLIDDFKKKC